MHRKLEHYITKTLDCFLQVRPSIRFLDGMLVKSPELQFDYIKLEIYNNYISKNTFI